MKLAAALVVALVSSFDLAGELPHATLPHDGLQREPERTAPGPRTEHPSPRRALVNCDDDNPCTDDWGDPDTGCVHSDNTHPCSDNNECTLGDVCGDGFCRPGVPVVCDDGNECTTDDACDRFEGCVHSNNTNPCNDGNACTVGDLCRAVRESTIHPIAGLIQGTDGALYGTANQGGRNDDGTVYKLNPDGTGFSVLQSFDDATTGSHPQGGLIQGADGALYGTATAGGINDCGTVYKLAPDGTGFTVLKYFDCFTTGGNPTAALIQGADGALYGTAPHGGSGNSGTVFKLRPNGTDFEVLMNFQYYVTGSNPYAGVIQGSDGALYGTAYNGGIGGGGGVGIGNGTAYKLNTDGSGFVVLQNFDYYVSGGVLQAGLVQGTDGALYGVTLQGGVTGYGTVFKLNPNGTGFAVLKTFDQFTTGIYPYGGLIQGADGALYGTASMGGSGSGGTVFKLNPNGTDFATIQNLHDPTTGGRPYGGLIQGVDGALYGTAYTGGSDGAGTVFKLNPNGAGFTVLKNLPGITANVCTPGTDTIDCNDDNPCTDDSCDPVAGCAHAANTSPCNDGHFCTDDACHSGICTGTPSPPPAAINNSVRLNKTPTNTTITWADPPGLYDVYRGSKTGGATWSYNHACWSTGVIGNSTADADAPLPGQLFYYLVARVNTCSESSLGSNSEGVPRPNDAACVIPPDADDHGVPNLFDHCPDTSNANQSDVDFDGFGDVCDNCAAVSNSSQGDTDGDGLGDECDADIDGDGVPNNVDNCVYIANPDQADSNTNGIGDECKPSRFRRGSTKRAPDQ